MGLNYLRGIIECDLDLKVWVIDPNRLALEKVKNFIDSRDFSNSQINFDFSETNHSLPIDIDLCIISTTADVRPDVLLGVTKDRHIRFLILEKLITQNTSDLELVSKNLFAIQSTWVNLPRRSMTWFNKIKQELEYKDISKFKGEVFGTNWNLVSNSLHYIDLFSFLFNVAPTRISLGGLDKIWFESRLGFYDTFGNIVAHFPNNSILTLTSISKKIKSQEGNFISIFTQDKTLEIDESGGKACYIQNNTKRDIFGQIELQSKMTSGLVKSILKDGICNLPKFKDIEHTHKIYLQSLANLETDGIQPPNAFSNIT